MSLWPRLAGIALSAMALGAAEHFEVRYFYDQDKSSLALSQIEFPSAKRGIAIGAMATNGKIRGVALLTSDSGASWQTVSLNEPPLSLFCLEETACWMVTIKGIWFSSEGGRDWRKIHSTDGLRQVWFRDRMRGFAVGARKKLIETRDGGKTWSKMAVAEKLESRSDRLAFSSITFLNPKLALIFGRSEPEEDTPVWLRAEPEYSREFPTLSVAIETKDGGETWDVGQSSIFGRVSRTRPDARAGHALVLLEFDRYFDYPSEIFRADFFKGSNERVLRRQDFAATDIALVPGGVAFAAGFQPLGKLARTPVPGKVRVMRSSGNYSLWADIAVDYRALARKVAIAISPAGTIWIATDEGMILQLVP